MKTQIAKQGKAFNAQVFRKTRIKCGNRSEVAKLEKMIARRRRQITVLEQGCFCCVNQIPTPVKAMIYVGDSDPELNSTINNRTDAKINNR